MRPAVPRADRVPLAASLTYRRVGEGDWLQSRVANMSQSGVLFGPTNLEPHTKVELIISSPIPVASLMPGRVVCVAEVVRTMEGGIVGARFEACRFLLDY